MSNRGWIEPNPKWVEADAARYKRKLQKDLGFDRVAELEESGIKKRAARLLAVEKEYDRKHRTSVTGNMSVQPAEESDILPSLHVLQPESVWRRIVIRAVASGGESPVLIVANERERKRIQSYAIHLVGFRAGEITPEALDKKYVELFGRKANVQDRMRTTLLANGLIDIIARADKDNSRG